jgi:hypothetical protein
VIDGTILGSPAGDRLGVVDGEETGPELGVELGPSLGLMDDSGPELGDKDGTVDGLRLCATRGEALGSSDNCNDGELLGVVDGVGLRSRVGDRLGVVDGREIGNKLGVKLGPVLGVKLGPVLGVKLDPVLGVKLDPALGVKLDPRLTVKLGDEDGMTDGVRLCSSSGEPLGCPTEDGIMLGIVTGCTGSPSTEGATEGGTDASVGSALSIGTELGCSDRVVPGDTVGPCGSCTDSLGRGGPASDLTSIRDIMAFSIGLANAITNAPALFALNSCVSKRAELHPPAAPKTSKFVAKLSPFMDIVMVRELLAAQK